jgi:hypothetical protein
LKENIYDLKLIDILKTQDLDTTFIVRYILKNDYQLLEEDKSITIDDVLKFQPHIDKNDLFIELFKYAKDDDSIEDFQSFSERKSK